MENKTETPKDTPVDDETVQKVLSLSKAQLKALGLAQQMPQSEKQKARNAQLAENNRIRNAQRKEERIEEQARKLAQIQSLKIVEKPKQKYTKKAPVVSSDEDSEEIRQFQEFQKFKQQNKKKPARKTRTPDTEEKYYFSGARRDQSDDDNGYIQQKTKKATELIETVNKLDSAIKNISSSNPYLALFNKK